jgi:transposase-like protein
VAKGKYQKWLTPESLTLLQGWARDGLTDEQIAHNMGISPSTLYAWRTAHPEISEALKKGKDVADYEVESALFKRATGFQYDEVTLEGGIETKRVTKMVAPDTGAAAMWLKNRRPDKWRDHPVDTQTDHAENNLLEQIKASAKAVDAKCSTDDSDKSS